MPLELKSAIVLLGEGDADRRFLTRLIEGRGGFCPVDIPFIGSATLHSNTKFGAMLNALEGDRHGFLRVKGVLIIADSASNPADTFKLIRDQIAAAQGFPVPPAPLQVAPKTAAHPAVAVMLLPDEQNAGALESLFVAEMEVRFPWITACVNTYLQCDKVEAHRWPPEKLAKSKYGSMVAALHYDDPSRAISYAFRDPPVVPITGHAFDNVERRIKEFCAAVGADAP